MTVGVLFLLSMFLWPLAAAIPAAATSPALVLVGALMMDGVRHIDWDDLSDALPAFLTIMMMPLTFSIANGVSFGIISYCAIKLLSGRARQVSPILYAIAALLLEPERDRSWLHRGCRRARSSQHGPPPITLPPSVPRPAAYTITGTRG